MTGSSSPTEFDGEGQFTSAIHFVTSEESKQIYYTSGHGEQPFSSSVLELMEKNNIEEKEQAKMEAQQIYLTDTDASEITSFGYSNGETEMSFPIMVWKRRYIRFPEAV